MHCVASDIESRFVARMSHELRAPVASMLLMAYGGEVMLDSASGKGSTFTLRFPRPKFCAWTSLLIIDDELPIRMALAEAFPGHGSQLKMVNLAWSVLVI